MSTGRDVPFRAFDPYDEVRTARRRLPHWHQPGVSYFVTFRLADSLPQPLLLQWRHERAIWLRLHPQPWGVDESANTKRALLTGRRNGSMPAWVLATCGGLMCEQCARSQNSVLHRQPACKRESDAQSLAALLDLVARCECRSYALVTTER